MPKSKAVVSTLLSPSRLPMLGLVLTGLLAACNPDKSNPPTPPTEPEPSAKILKINFQPADSTVPAGYTADTGAAYNDGRGYGWVAQAGHAPLDVSVNARDRKLSTVEDRLNTFIHMQYNSNVSGPAVRTPAAWEYKVTNGTYTVTVSTGDASNSLDSNHALNIEGVQAIAPYMPAATNKFRTVTLRVPVADGKLTIDAVGGTNTKINYVIVAPGNLPSARDIGPEDGQTMVDLNEAVTVDVNLPGGAIKLSTVTSDAAYLTERGSAVKIPATITTSGGGDAVIVKPQAALKPMTAYTFNLTSALKDVSGNSFLPAHSTFVTGAGSTTGGEVAFTQVPQGNVPSYPYTSVEIGPDGKLYAATLTGEILRFGIQANGTLDKPQIIKSVQTANSGPRTIIGLKFDPASTADNLILWISNNYFWDGSQQAPEWSGKITRLSGPNLDTVQDYVTGLPRSIRDHETNSISFKPGETGALYVLQGSDSSTGAPDDVWGNRPEKLLNAALLRVDVSKITQPPLNVKTAEGGTYNPYAPGAAVTLYATGIRNAYDMVWAKNGSLYVPANGAAASGNTPSTPATLPASCNNRPDGPYTGPAVRGQQEHRHSERLSVPRPARQVLRPSQPGALRMGPERWQSHRWQGHRRGHRVCRGHPARPQLGRLRLRLWRARLGQRRDRGIHHSGQFAAQEPPAGGALQRGQGHHRADARRERRHREGRARDFGPDQFQPQPTGSDRGPDQRQPLCRPA